VFPRKITRNSLTVSDDESAIEGMQVVVVYMYQTLVSWVKSCINKI